MPLFGGHADEENAKLRGELARIDALPLPQLAGEVMTRVFGPGGQGEGGGTVKLQDVAGAFNPAEGSFGIDDDALRGMYDVVCEGVQVLEHAGLVRVIMSNEPRGSVLYSWAVPTRLGRLALDRRSVDSVLAGSGV
jgi:hypothetical protein